MRLDRLALKLLACAALCAGLAAPAQAQAPAPAPAPAPLQLSAERPFTLIAGLGFDRGSARLMTITLTDGSTQTMRANEGFYFEGGVAFLKQHLDAVSLETAATIAVKGWNVGASNGSLDYLAFPLEVLERLTYEQVRLGLGASILLSPRLSSSGVLSGNDVDLKDSAGLLVQADWIGKRTPGRLGIYLGARATFQKLEPKNGGTAVNANAIGVRLGFEY